jgi:antitoxin (DNA-binding transcriptional repressor) of toxin-antitoxin stability system
MATPISALQRNAASVVRKVTASGVAEEITDRGRVVAVLTPPPVVDGLQRLRQAGVTRAADSRLLHEALAQVGSIPPLDLAGALAEQRDHER